MCLQRPPEILRLNEAFQRYQESKDQLCQDLQKLADNADGLILDHVDQDLEAVKKSMTGRGIVIGSGIASICLYTSPVGVALGIGGILAGYALVGESKHYKLRCKNARADQMKRILEDLQKGMNNFEIVQGEVLEMLDGLGMFTIRNPDNFSVDFKENYRKIRDMIEDFESQTKSSLNQLLKYLLSVKEKVEKLPGMII